MAATTPPFELWLEFEHWEPTPNDDPYNDFFNTGITLPDGRVYSLNVWTFAFLPRAREQAREFEEGLDGKYLLPPDLFVGRLDRGLLEEVVADILRHKALKEEWRSTGADA